MNEDRTEGWPQSARDWAITRILDRHLFKETMRYRNKAEGTPARIKRKSGFQRLRRRTDAQVIPLKGEKDETLCDLSDEELRVILDRAAAAVGAARTNESLAMAIVADLVQIVTLEQLHDERTRFVANTAFTEIPTVKELELLALLEIKEGQSRKGKARG